MLLWSVARCPNWTLLTHHNITIMVFVLHVYTIYLICTFAFSRQRSIIAGPFSRSVSSIVFSTGLDHQALRAPEHPALRKAFQIATGKSSFEVGGRKKFRRALMIKKDEATQALKEMLKGSSPAATTDIWKSNSNVSLESSRIINNSMPDQNHSKYHTTYQLPVRIISYNIW